ncbi:S10 family peptidase [Ancylobacter mangrovi]|uniref:S10 family peptidase n=1 Tax=Ancylobacter mangrovi TaxID=2972472 RepID=UPI002163552F|nr:peptidase S10 [Ancylobacter mangrovi]MCS0503266.1 peptidase S10 [Ancylobacter mangrovi]
MRFHASLTLARVALIAAAALAPLNGAWSQDAPPRHGPSSGAEQDARKAGPSAGLSLPADSVTRHELVLGDRTLRYTATAGSLPVRDTSGRKLADIAYVAYVLDRAPDEAPASRPVTFAFNGGPGAASAYLNLGMMGPRRLRAGGQGDSPSSPPLLVDNVQSWLDFTDLVFVDPVGTGFSRFASDRDEDRKLLWSVEGDYKSLARVVTNWLRQNNRLASPKFLVGESYGGFRVPKIARELQTGDGIGVSGLVMLSPVLDFTYERDSRSSPLKWVVPLPSMAATRLEREGKLSPDALHAAESYATGDYLADLMKGPRDRQAVARMTDRVAALTGLDRDVIERLGGKVDTRTFLREIDRDRQMVASPYDSNVAALDPDPDSARDRAPDAVLDALTAPLTSAMLDYYANDLKWQLEGRYFLLNDQVSHRWDYGEGRGDRESMSELRDVLALDPRVQVIVAHGFTDLVTPYFESRLLLDQLPALGDPSRVRLELFPGGHMFYWRDGSRAGLHDAVRSMVEAKQG